MTQGSPNGPFDFSLLFIHVHVLLFFHVHLILYLVQWNVQFQKISIPTPWKVSGNSEVVGGLKGQNLKKESMGLKWKFRRGGG